MARRSYKSGDSLSKWYYRGYNKAYHESYHAGYNNGYGSVYGTEYANGTTLAATEGQRNATSSFNSMNNYNLKGDMEPYNVLRFTARVGSRVSFTNEGGNTPTMYWRLKGGSWAGYSSEDYFDLNAGDYVEVYGDNIDGFSKSSTVYTQFNITGAVECTGKVSALISGWIDTFEIPCDYCFYKLFSECTGLISAPELPATTLTQYCYYTMFFNCSALTVAPELPATTLAGSCYLYMFYGCSALTEAPELPATTLASYCYSRMFYKCSALTVAPELPATTLAASCYADMFRDCSSLTVAPELPAETLVERCYQYMFYGCSALTVAPELPAEKLSSYCYNYMFYNCKKLQFVTTYATTWRTGYASYWLYGAGTEAFYPTVFCHSSNNIATGTNNGIPTDWKRSEIGSDTVVEPEYLEDYNLGLADGAAVGRCDGEAQGRASGTSAGAMNGYYDNIKIHFYTNLVGYSESLSKSGRITGIVRRLEFSAPSTGAELTIINYNYNDVLLFYSFDGNTWRHVSFSGTIEDDSFTITNNKSTTTYLMGFNIGSLNKSNNTYIKYINITKANTEISVVSSGNTGDINALKLGINIGGYIRSARKYDFYNLFQGNTTLLTAPELPATTLSDNCYVSMFNGCSSLRYIKVYATTWNTSYASNWVSGVSKLKGCEFHKPSGNTQIPQGSDHGIPLNWGVVPF